MDELSLAHALTASDRCDRCGAAAITYVELPSGFELMFCGHHMHEHLEALRESGARVFTQLVEL